MGLLTFRGGIRLPAQKDLSKDKPIRTLLPNGEFVYPLLQHKGAPAKPIVEPGEYVRKGQLIADAGEYVSVPVHASVSGTVKAIEPRCTATGSQIDSIILESDGLFQEVAYHVTGDIHKLYNEEILERIREAGVAGMSGAGMPTHVKLFPKNPGKIDYIIANGVECEPYLSADYREMLENPEKMIEGMRILLKLFDHAKGVFGIADDKPACIEKLMELTIEEPRMEVVRLRTKYPQGAERQLIYAITGRAIPYTTLPSDKGYIVDNVATLGAVYDAVKLGRPVTTRVVTVSGDAVKEPCNFRCPIGTSFRSLLDAAGGWKVQPEKVIAGGPMMGAAIASLDVPVTKITTGLVGMKKDGVPAERDATACINCGRCIRVCPVRIVPSRLSALSRRGDRKNFEKTNGMECMECGSCDFICPAKIRLVQDIRGMKVQILTERSLNRRSERGGVL